MIPLDGTFPNTFLVGFSVSTTAYPVPVMCSFRVGVGDKAEAAEVGATVLSPKRFRYVRFPSIETKPSPPTGLVITSAFWLKLMFSISTKNNAVVMNVI